MKRGFQLPCSFERNTATIEPQSAALPRPNLELPGFLVGSGPRVFSLAEAGGGSSSAGRDWITLLKQHRNTAFTPILAS